MMLRRILSVLVLPLAACSAAPDAARGPSLTDQDQALAGRLMQRTLEHVPDGTTRRWQNEQSGNAGAITPIATYVSLGGVFCRDYLEELRVDGTSEAATKAACRDPEARWIGMAGPAPSSQN